MDDALDRYRSLERKLAHVRWRHEGYESDEEDAILEEMDEIWLEMAELERDSVNSEGPKTFIQSGSRVVPVRRVADRYPLRESVRSLREVS